MPNPLQELLEKHKDRSVLSEPRELWSGPTLKFFNKLLSERLP